MNRNVMGLVSFNSASFSCSTYLFNCIAAHIGRTAHTENVDVVLNSFLLLITGTTKPKSVEWSAVLLTSERHECKTKIRKTFWIKENDKNYEI